jgi:hypothetical protein
MNYTKVKAGPITVRCTTTMETYKEVYVSTRIDGDYRSFSFIIKEEKPTNRIKLKKYLRMALELALSVDGSIIRGAFKKLGLTKSDLSTILEENYGTHN